MRIVKSCFLLAMVLIFLSCRSEIVSLQELNEYIRDEKNGLLKKEESKGIQSECVYRPSSLLVSQELNEGDTAGIGKLKEKYNQNLYFLLSFSQNGKEVLGSLGDQAWYSEMVQVFSFRMGEHINMTTSLGDTLYLSDYAFQNTYRMSGSNTLLLAFEGERAKKADWLQLNINEFGLGTGILHFKYRRENLESVPDLKFN